MKKITGYIIVIAVFLIAFNIFYVFGTERSVMIQVSDKERVVSSDSSKYLVFTETEVFENTDCLLRFKFNSSDLQGALKKQGRYTIVVYGWRIPLFSTYRNIASIN